MMQDEQCPVPDSVLGELYRSSPEGLHLLLETVSPNVRAMLAVYCYRRAHLMPLALAIASTCEKRDMVAAGREFGQAVFEQSREAPKVVTEKKRKVTLSRGPFLQLVIAQDLI